MVIREVELVLVELTFIRENKENLTAIENTKIQFNMKIYLVRH